MATLTWERGWESKGQHCHDLGQVSAQNEADPREALNKTAVLSPEKKVEMGVGWCYIELRPPKKIH